MKLSKSLLQAILVGVTIGTATTSCSMLDSVTGTDEEDCRVEHRHLRADSPDTCWDCPVCGMG